MIHSKFKFSTPATEPAPTEKPAVTTNTPEPPVTLYAVIAILTVCLALALLRKPRGAAGALLIAASLSTTGCVSVSRLATMDDVDEVRESIAVSAEAQRDAYEAALAAGKPVGEAASVAFSTGVEKQREAQAAAKEAGGESNWPLWAELLAVILGGGTAGTILTRIVRGAPLRSGSGASKAAKAATAT